jgi:hypothetical protein
LECKSRIGKGGSLNSGYCGICLKQNITKRSAEKKAGFADRLNGILDGNALDPDAFEAGAQNLAEDDAPATCNDLVLNHVKTAVLVGSDDP